MTKKFAQVTFIILLGIAVLSVIFPQLPKALNPGNISAADTAWMLTSTALVLIMTPGLAFFYGGMVNKKNVLSTMLQSFICMAVISIIWVFIGFSLSFGDSINGIIGNPKTFFLMKNVCIYILKHSFIIDKDSVISHCYTLSLRAIHTRSIVSGWTTDVV